MIRKLVTDEYLKPFGEMSEEEREAYRDRVGEWLASDGERLLALTDRPMARAQNLMMLSGRWAKDDSEAVHNGARLLTALMAMTDTWLPSQLWFKSAWRAIRHIVETLRATPGHPITGRRVDVSANQKVQIAQTQAQIKTQHPANEPQTKTQTGPKAGVKEEPAPEPNSKLPEEQTDLSITEMAEGRVASFVPARPKHIDQYVYLLPKGTQERAGAVRGLLRELDDTREKMRLLMGDVQAKPDARAALAKRAARIDMTLKGIYKELDAEWEKFVKSGRITVDALGNASVGPLLCEGGEPVAELTSEQKARRRELRKWLIDLRRGKDGEARERRVEQWKANWQEYLMLEPLEAALKDEKVVAAAAHFGIVINPDKQR